jgi:hypothetical protein
VAATGCRTGRGGEMNDGARRIVIERFPLNIDGKQAVTSVLTRRGDTWEATDSNGNVTAFDDVTKAARSLEALIFVSGEVLRISTGGLVEAMDVLPWLRWWVGAPEGEPIDMERWAERQPAGVWWHELVWSHSDSVARILADRAIVIDNTSCAVFESGALRTAVLFDEMEQPVFVEKWATLELHNGYGGSNHVKGLICSGVIGEAADYDGLRTLSLRPAESKDVGESVQELIDWAGSLLSFDTEFQGTPLQVDRNGRFSVTDHEYINVSGGIEPDIWALHRSNRTSTAEWEHVVEHVKIIFERHPVDVPEHEAERWSIRPVPNGWEATLPDGSSCGAVTLDEVVAASGACRFKPESVLKIRTGGLVPPAGALAWICEWIEAPEAEQLDFERSGEIEEIGRWRDSLVDVGDSGDLDTLFDRAIFIDGFPCQIVTDGSFRSALLSDGHGSPMFFDIWGSLHVGNNWGTSYYSYGELSPGVEATFSCIEDYEYFTITAHDPSKASLFGSVLGWAQGVVGITSGGDEATVAISEDGGIYLSGDEVGNEYGLSVWGAVSDAVLAERGDGGLSQT